MNAKRKPSSPGDRAAHDTRPRRGALAGERYRVAICTDLGGRDEDDIQSLIHFLHYADLFDTEGLVSSPPGAGRARNLLRVLSAYAEDYHSLIRHSDRYPRPDHLRQVVKQGAVETASPQGYGEPTEGSQWIIDCARRVDARPLYVLVWGAITDLAQALHDAPDIESKLRVYFIASWNRRRDPHALAYLDRRHPDVWMILNESTFRGWYLGGNQNGYLDNRQFVNRHLADHGAMGRMFAPLKNGSLKMGDSPSTAWLLSGCPDDPTQPSWGGRFVPRPGHPQGWTDDPAFRHRHYRFKGARTVNRWRESYLQDWALRTKRVDRLRR